MAEAEVVLAEVEVAQAVAVGIQDSAVGVQDLAVGVQDSAVEEEEDVAVVTSAIGAVKRVTLQGTVGKEVRAATSKVATTTTLATHLVQITIHLLPIF